MATNYTAAHSQLEQQRWQCDQAAREVADWRRVAFENALDRAGELAQMGRLTEARRVVEIALAAR